MVLLAESLTAVGSSDLSQQLPSQVYCAAHVRTTKARHRNSVLLSALHYAQEQLDGSTHGGHNATDFCQGQRHLGNLQEVADPACYQYALRALRPRAARRTRSRSRKTPDDESPASDRFAESCEIGYLAH